MAFPCLLSSLRIQVIILAIISTALAVSSDVFMTWANVCAVLSASASIGILAIGATFVIGARGIDLSVVSIVALSAVCAILPIGQYDTPPSACEAVLRALLVGSVCGAVSGACIRLFSIPAFIVTLAMMSVARGAALIATDGRPVYGLPLGLVALGQGLFLGVPAPVWIFLGVAVASHIVMHHTAFGLRLMMHGDNPRAVRYSGISPISTTIALYVLSGGIAAIAGLITMGRVNAADPASGAMYELAAITAAVIGGSSLRGGNGSIAGAVLGTLIVGVIQNGLILLDVAPYYQQIALGVILLLASLRKDSLE